MLTQEEPPHRAEGDPEPTPVTDDTIVSGACRTERIIQEGPES